MVKIRSKEFNQEKQFQKELEYIGYKAKKFGARLEDELCPRDSLIVDSLRSFFNDEGGFARQISDEKIEAIEFYLSIYPDQDVYFEEFHKVYPNGDNPDFFK